MQRYTGRSKDEPGQKASLEAAFDDAAKQAIEADPGNDRKQFEVDIVVAVANPKVNEYIVTISR